MKYFCPICQSDCLIIEKGNTIFMGDGNISSITYYDVKCVHEDHMYLGRLKEDKITKIKIRLDDLFCKFYFEENFIEIWYVLQYRPAYPYFPIPAQKRIRINSIFYPDFSDISKLKNKIENFLTFI